MPRQGQQVRFDGLKELSPLITAERTISGDSSYSDFANVRLIDVKQARHHPSSHSYQSTNDHQLHHLVDSELKQRNGGYQAADADDEEYLSEYDTTSIFSEVQPLCTLTLSVLLGALFEFLPALINTSAVGHLNNKTFMSVASLSNLWFSATALSLLYGVTSVLDTTCPSVYGALVGDRKDHSSKHHVTPHQLDKAQSMIRSWQRIALITVFVFCAAVSVPLAIVATPVLTYLKQQPHIIALTQQYLYILLCGLPFLAVYDAHKRTLQAQQLVYPVIITTGIGTASSVLFHYLLLYTDPSLWYRQQLYHDDSLVLNGAIAMSLTYAVLCIVLLILSPIARRMSAPGAAHSLHNGHLHSATNGGTKVPPDESPLTIYADRHMPLLQRWRVYVSLAIPATIQSVLEFGGFDALGLLAGALPEAAIDLPSHAALFQISLLGWVVYSSIGTATAVRTGTHLGANKVYLSKLAAYTGVFAAMICAAVMAPLLSTYRATIGQLFTYDSDVVARISDLIICLVIYSLFDAIYILVAAILRALGRQAVTAVLTFVALVCISVPGAYYSGYVREYGLLGIWGSLTVGVAVAAIIGLVILFSVDWENEAQQIQLQRKARTIIA